MITQNISSYAASTAFFIFISMVPMLGLLFAIIPYLNLTEQVIIDFLSDWMPEQTMPFVIEIIQQVYTSSVGILSFAAVALVWTAAKGILALMRGLNAVNEVVEERNYVIIRLIAAFYMLIVLGIVLLSLLLMVFGDAITAYIIAHVPSLMLFFDFLNIFKMLVVWVLLILVFMAMYAYVPNKKLKFREQLPGAFFSTVAWSVFSWGFSLYINHTQSFTIYGSLSIIVILMLWLYFCFYILIVGAYINRYLKPLVYHLKQKNHLTKLEEVSKINGDKDDA